MSQQHVTVAAAGGELLQTTLFTGTAEKSEGLKDDSLARTTPQRYVI